MILTGKHIEINVSILDRPEGRPLQPFCSPALVIIAAVSILDRPEGRPLLLDIKSFYDDIFEFQSSIAPKDDRYPKKWEIYPNENSIVSILDRPEGRPLL